MPLPVLATHHLLPPSHVLQNLVLLPRTWAPLSKQVLWTEPARALHSVLELELEAEPSLGRAIAEPGGPPRFHVARARVPGGEVPRLRVGTADALL